MDEVDELAQRTPRAWPVLAALAGVVLLASSTLLVDLVVSRRTAVRTQQMVDNAQRSIELVDDLREQAHRLADATTPRQLRDAATRIAADAVAYDPLADFRDERDEWRRLQSRLAELQRFADQPDFDDSGIVAGVTASIDRLVVINREAARAQAAAIARVHRAALVADASVGGLTVLLVAVIVVMTLRALARGKALAERMILLLAGRNRELDAFAARAAHDLIAPLSPIRGYADLLMSGDEPPDEVRQMASRIRVGVDRMARVVEDMLELSRAGRPAPGRASPAAVAAEVLDELAAELDGAEVRRALTDEPVACAPGVLAQIVRNLVVNAVKFRSRQRRLVVDVRARVLDGAVELSVADNGVGMDADSAAHAFQPYWRGRPQEREVPGHGLGLAIVDRTTRALGGSCTLRSAVDEGTEVTVRLPRA